MRTDGRESDNVEDRRGESFGGSGGRGLPVGRLGIGTIVVALIASYFLGVDPRVVMGVLGGMDTGAPSVEAPRGPAPRPSDEIGRFVSVVLADTEDTWHQLFREAGRNYREPTLALFAGRYPTACGTGLAAAGPFYCPADQKVYLDTTFFEELQRRFRAPGDFAQAYVIAHEVGHHVQNQLGVMAKMQQMRERLSETQFNQLSVRVELQADCFAGIWAHHAQRSRQVLEAGDLEEALRAASAIGDDTLQRQMQGQVVPESFTHGSSEQRTRWFRRGYEHGRMAECNTFEAKAL